MPSADHPAAVQATFDELGSPLSETTFVVVDLETTGGSPLSCAITEIGAVKVRGGVVLGEFQTLVNPQTAIPAFIAVLTGITNAMVADAPTIATVLPAFFEFSRGTVLVAHNAPFDLGFLKAACEQHQMVWPGNDSIDTVRLARRVLSRDEAPNCKLATLARLFRTEVTPNHRALADAQATVDVLHGLIDRLGALGVHSVEEMRTFSSQVSPAQRRKRHLADALPTLPGVYLFRDEAGRVLYIGKSNNLRTRVRQYFTASEMRTRMAEMVGLAERVDPVVCSTTLEADVRELRLIAEHRPPYNRRSKFPDKASWLKLTVEVYPRLSLVRKVLDDGATYLGPFGTSSSALLAMTALHEAIPLRQCTSRLSAVRRSPACVLADLGRCGAPCQGAETPPDYARHGEVFRALVSGAPSEVVSVLTARIRLLAEAERFEEAAAQRDRLGALVRAVARLQRLRALTVVTQLVAARPTAELGWDVAVISCGRLVASGTVPRGAAPGPFVDALIATAETVLPGPGPLPACTAEEASMVLRWLEHSETRLVRLDGQWASPAHGCGVHLGWLAVADQGQATLHPFDDPRATRPVGRSVLH